jgi:quinohemoprotein amine dehydrogenase
MAVLLTLPLLAQQQGGGRAGGRGGAAPDVGAAKPTPEVGIPVTDPLVIAKCGSCHTKDDKGNLSRISWERTTPEGWQEAIKRMVRLNGLELKPEEARAIVKSLSLTHGLAPDEAKPVMYIAEQRMIDEQLPNDTVREACASCHAIGRARSWRRSKEEWDLLAAMHSGYFPVADFNFRRFRPPPAPDAPPPQPGVDNRQPVDQAVDYLSKTYPLNTPEWAAWRARMRAPKLSGRWIISGYQAGRGKVIGEMAVEPGAAEDEFTTNVKLTYLKDGSTVTRTGKSMVYSGYSWRGRSTTKNPVEAAPGKAGGVPAELREVMWVAPDQSEMEGRWFWGAYEEFGYDVTLHRAGEGATVLGVDQTMLKTGATAQRVRVYGDNFRGASSQSIAIADVDFGSGVTVKRIVDQTAQLVTVEVDVDAKAIVGKRDVSVRRAVAPNAIAVYDKIDYIKVSPETALARLGGTTHPKGFQQFDAIAYNRGPDDKPNTADDVELGPVDAEWSVEEFYAVYGDDDKEFVGALSPSGYFTPALEGPNPKRKFSRNNYGDVWVVATYKGEKGKDGKPLTAKSYLVVAIPLYVRWDQPEVAQ